LFSAGILHSESSREQTIRTVPLATVARSSREILDICLQELPVGDAGASGGWMDDVSFGRFTARHGEIQVPQTLVAGVVVAASLLNQMAQHQHYYEQQTQQELGADESALQVSCCRAMRAVLKEWTRQRAANWKVAKLIPLDSAQLVVWQAVLWLSLFPRSGDDLMRQGLVEVTLPALQLHVQEMADTAVREAEALKTGQSADPMAAGLTYHPSEDLAICIGAFSNLLEQFETRATEALLESGVIVEVLGVLFQRSRHRELVPSIVTIIHRMSCVNVTSCAELVESGAEAVETYRLRGFIEGEENPDCDLALVDWLCDHLRLALEHRMSLADKEECAACFGTEVASADLAEGEVGIAFAVMTTQMADTLSNLCRVKSVRERVVTKHGAFMSVLCEFMEWDLRHNADQMRAETASGWAYSVPAEAGLVASLSSVLAVWTMLAPVMYGAGDGSLNAEVLSLPTDLIPACLFVAAHVTDIECADQVRQRTCHNYNFFL
jgi:hypothetical protein